MGLVSAVFAAAWDWFLGLFAFSVVSVVLLIAAYLLFYLHGLVGPRDFRRKSVVSPVSGFTLTLLDRGGVDIASARISDPNAPFNLEVKRPGLVSRYALLRAGQVVREGNVLMGAQVGDVNDLRLVSVLVDPPDVIHIRTLPAGWFPS